LTRDAEFFDADVVIATGQRTGNAATAEEIKTIKASTYLPVCVGSGVNIENIGDILSVADGVIIASSLKRDGVWWNEVDPDRVSMFMKEVRNVR
jgi:predicted TIM-barrel enzyme